MVAFGQLAMNRVTDNRVNDWREVIPVVRPFYERFFDEPFPEDLEERVSILKWWEEDKGRCYFETRTFAIREHMSFQLTADTLAHELSHDLYEQEQKLHGATWTKLKKADSPRKKKIWEKKCGVADFISEVVAYAVSELLNYLHFDRSRFKRVEAFAGEYYNGLSKSAIVNSCVGYCRSRSTENHKDGRYRCAKFLGAYLAKEHKDNPQLWNKLKQLRTLDDLRRLVNE